MDSAVADFDIDIESSSSSRSSEQDFDNENDNDRCSVNLVLNVYINNYDTTINSISLDFHTL